jgi:hypothetical protein
MERKKQKGGLKRIEKEGMKYTAGNEKRNKRELIFQLKRERKPHGFG